jgi:hypothetical protein
MKTMKTMVTLLALTCGCSGANFDVSGLETDTGPGAQETDPATDAAPETETDTAQAETGVPMEAGTDTGAEAAPTETGMDTGGADAGGDTKDTGPDAVVGDTSPTTDSGMVDTGPPPVICTAGATRCTGMQPEYCTPDGTAWGPIAGDCGYSCVIDPTKGAACACGAPTTRLQIVADAKSPTGTAIKDSKTGITWAPTDYGTGAGWNASDKMCALYYGTGGWRVPTKSEYDGILAQFPGLVPGVGISVKTTCVPGSIDADPIFKFHETQYMSRDSDPVTGNGYFVRILTGVWTTQYPDTVGALRCVHD